MWQKEEHVSMKTTEEHQPTTGNQKDGVQTMTDWQKIQKHEKDLKHAIRQSGSRMHRKTHIFSQLGAEFWPIFGGAGHTSVMYADCDCRK
jgi:hypothetical protein